MRSAARPIKSAQRRSLNFDATEEAVAGSGAAAVISAGAERIRGAAEAETGAAILVFWSFARANMRGAEVPGCRGAGVHTFGARCYVACDRACTRVAYTCIPTYSY